MVSTFAGGFKRLHGAFRSGALARVNSGSHYGFVEGGAVLSKLQPGLATLFALDDGSVGMKTWCRWRAPYWHGTRVLDPRSHANYHLGFRCCKSLPVQ